MAFDTKASLLPEILLKNSAEKEEIELLAEDIVGMANCFEDDNFHADISNLNFEEAYCVYIEANVLDNIPKKLDELRENIKNASKVWNIPVDIKGKNVVVQVSEKLDYEENEDSNKWNVASAIDYGEKGNPCQQLEKWLSKSDNVENRQCVLIGGENGIRTLLAIVIQGNHIKEMVSLGKEISYMEFENKEPIPIKYCIGAGCLILMTYVGILYLKKRNKENK